MNATTHPDELAPLPELPELSDETIARIERDVFEGIHAERTTVAAKASRRRRGLWITTGAAAVVVVAAVIAPSLAGLGPQSSGGSADVAVEPASPEMLTRDSAGGGESTDMSVDATAGREVIATATATVLVPDARDAARTIGDLAVARGGYVESMTLEGAAVDVPADGGVAIDPMMPYPGGWGQWITVRVPADQLDDAIAELSELGDVQASSINRYDVTEQAVDLRARIDAAQASVDRLTELMGQAGSVADLIAAEQALSERQGLLESYQQQLTALESQIALSSLTVTLTEPAEAVAADPAGFGDGLAAGWNGLVATINGIVIGLGFLLPWLAIVAVAALIVWGIVRAVRRRRRGRERVEAP